jgi:hypothetical protein
LRAPIFVLIAIAVMASAALSLRFVVPAVAARDAVRDLVTAADHKGYGSLPVVQLHTIERTAEFYAANRITYGSDGEPVKFEGANQVIDAARRNGGRVLCLVPTRYVPQLTTSPNAQSEILADNGRVCLVSLTVK